MVRAAADQGKRFIDNACQAHAVIQDYSLEQTTKGGQEIKVTFELVACTDQAQKNKTMSEKFPLEGGGVGKLWDLLEATRIVPRGCNRKQEIDFDERQLKMRQCYVKIHLQRGQKLNNVTGKYEDDPEQPEYPRIGFNSIWDLRDAKVAALPKDPEFLAQWPELPGGGGQAGGAGGQGQSAPLPPPQQQGSPPAAATPPTAAGTTSMNW